MDLYVWWRVFNITLAGGAWLLLVIDLWRRHHVLDKRCLYLTFSLGGYHSAAVIGSLFTVLSPDEVPVNFVTPIITASATWSLIGTIISWNDQDVSSRKK